MLVYLDNSATTKPAASVTAAVKRMMEEDFGNPSSMYELGLNAEKILKEARQTVAKSLGAAAEEVFFTSGGTESDNAAIFGTWESRRKQGRRVITTQVEHPAVLRACERLDKNGADVVYLPVGKDGIVDLQALESALDKETILVSVMHVNNESGAIMPVAEIGRMVKKINRDIVFHVDAVQSFQKIDTDVNVLGADMVSLSAHKIHGPKGIGALYVRKNVYLPPFIYGGGQEGGFRSGTENMPGIAGFAQAVRGAQKTGAGGGQDLGEVKSYLLSLIVREISDIKINTPLNSAPSVLNISFLGCRGEVLLHTLEQSQIYVSTGSACSSKKKGSHVLAAMGLSEEEVEGALRFSFCGDNTKEQMDYVAQKLKEAVESQRRLRKAFRKG
jgi:cysteine desulfurase